MIRNYLLIIFSFLVFSINSYSQGVFQRVFGTGSGKDIIEAADHNFIYTGGTGSQVIASKIDSAGDTIWIKYFGPTNGMTPNNIGYSITYINDNKYLITGQYYPGTSSYTNLYAIMIDSAGSEIWENNYGNGNWSGSNATYDNINQKIYYVGTYAGANILIVKSDTAGNFIWGQTYNYGLQSGGLKIAMRSDTDIFIIGSMSVTLNNNDGILLEVDSVGTAISMKHYGGINDDEFEDFKILPDSGFMIVGTTKSYANYGEGWLLRLDKNGDTIWIKTFGQNHTTGNQYFHFAISTLNTIWICGNVFAYDSLLVNQAWIFETDTSGNILYNSLFGGQNKYLNSIIESSNHSILAVGETGANLVSDVYFIRLDTDYLYTGIKDNILSERITIYPNPSINIVYMKIPDSINLNEIQIFISDVLGKSYSVKYSQIQNNLFRLELPFANGLYMIIIKDTKQILKNKIIIQN